MDPLESPEGNRKENDPHFDLLAEGFRVVVYILTASCIKVCWIGEQDKFRSRLMRHSGDRDILCQCVERRVKNHMQAAARLIDRPLREANIFFGRSRGLRN